MSIEWPSQTGEYLRILKGSYSSCNCPSCLSASGVSGFAVQSGRQEATARQNAKNLKRIRFFRILSIHFLDKKKLFYANVFGRVILQHRTIKTSAKIQQRFIEKTFLFSEIYLYQTNQFHSQIYVFFLSQLKS